ncbi:hypothetical protein IU459_25130 [Nocardia amamiensis]|uniref:Uncharacterized protein n=1 Tax=Nocardia amamiensis TaxID=404578 RepID=A0ABS0CW20_9NOCA|nr:hypothetical protein [Nocardia amamiensis]MBF6300803.1 hypothetical protein [Nocardia amamiensis]
MTETLRALVGGTGPDWEIRELQRRAEPDLLMICAHDPSMFEHARATQ